MIKFLPAVVLLVFTGHAFAQKDSIPKYLNANLEFTTKKEAVYAAIVTKENNRWVLTGVYPDSTVLLKIYYKDAALTIKDGPFTLYFLGKVVAQKGNFINNIPQGHWQSFYQNGQIKDEGDITDNHFLGTWNAFFENGLPKSIHNYIYKKDFADAGEPVHENSPAKKIVKVVDNLSPEGKMDGANFTWYENGNRESVVHYQNDTLTGLCTWYRPNGRPSSIETYASGKLTDLECYDSLGNYTGSTCSISKLPVFISVFSAEDYIENELHKERHRGITFYGDVEVHFTITRDGKVDDIVIVSSPDAGLSRIVLGIISKMPAWSAAVTHNRKIDYPMKVVIPYYGDQ